MAGQYEGEEGGRQFPAGERFVLVRVAKRGSPGPTVRDGVPEYTD